MRSRMRTQPSRVLLQVRWPTIPIVFCETRKLAQDSACGVQEPLRNADDQRARACGRPARRAARAAVHREALEPNEHRVLVAQPATARQRMDSEPRSQRDVRCFGHRHFAVAAGPCRAPRTADDARWRAAAAGRARRGRATRQSAARSRRARAATSSHACRAPSVDPVRAARFSYSISVSVSGGPALWRGTFTPAATSWRPSSRASARTIER
jgi:hypothetical protein